MLAKLDPTPALHDAHKLDMIYGLLHDCIRRLLPRYQVNTFADVIKKARSIENNILEINHTENGKDKFQRKERPKCFFCHNFGHAQIECRKFTQTTSKSKGPDDKDVNVQRNTIGCYGCNTPGVIRSKYANCNKAKQDDIAESNLIEFHQINIAGALSKCMKPLLPVTINGFHGVSSADSVAQISIASHELYQLFEGKVIICQWKK